MSNRMSPVHEDYYFHKRQNFEYPSHINPCYVYCDSPQMLQRIIQLVDEAKHLQEERKFEVSNLRI
ncbi:hypothetical protein DERP_004096 [Dermatophagoides pteronyssinus]|uniref:Uncharacterized protein n=1 Tax=Dermatophagoides pteronyssinus TaxID=6956 RepID=A0ABQ8J8M1_DERPT|nr:hypothetical protein DERP_004096 [Dermatophagoides pteronyssinus]